jgi:hypothetical protein
MGAALLYLAAAETDIRVMRDKTPRDDVTSPLAMVTGPQSYKRFHGKATNNLNVSRFKLDQARTRFNALTEGEQHNAVPNDVPAAKPSANRE